jgi:hypothetical protein
MSNKRIEHMRITTGLIAALALVSGSAIAAEDTGFYVGASVGQGSFALNTSKVNRASLAKEVDRENFILYKTDKIKHYYS